jgi:hypothetical protein
MHTIDVRPAEKLAHLLFFLGLDAKANYGDIGELRALAQGPFIRISISEAKSARKIKGELQALLAMFYRDCGFADLDRQLIVRRLGQFGELLLVAQFTEFFDIADEDDVDGQLSAINEEIARFTDYLQGQVEKRLL